MASGFSGEKANGVGSLHTGTLGARLQELVDSAPLESNLPSSVGNLSLGSREGMNIGLPEIRAKARVPETHPGPGHLEYFRHFRREDRPPSSCGPVKIKRRSIGRRNGKEEPREDPATVTSISTGGYTRCTINSGLAFSISLEWSSPMSYISVSSLGINVRRIDSARSGEEGGGVKDEHGTGVEGKDKEGGEYLDEPEAVGIAAKEVEPSVEGSYVSVQEDNKASGAQPKTAGRARRAGGAGRGGHKREQAQCQEATEHEWAPEL
ncbi:hypothetical protein WN55_05470 [Dufourea novaeangliae]|uniref:Uncharacterized protein n=1 Tax=Dufourea novaeangliae TaxID=178035 RepID=A0A154PMG2_DUFNO|nr:hypothetical protein WN55_05470 [Dufourea novaeangliae]